MTTIPATKDAPPVHPGLERKSIVASPESGLLAADDATGVVEAIVSVTGIEDETKDTIEPGAYAETLTKRIPKGIFAHDWGRWVARTEEVKELMPGDPRLPKQTRDGQPWPAEAGALYVKSRFNLGSDEGRNAYHNVKFFSETGECEWSIGYQVPKGRAVRTRNGGRRIKALDLYEYSPVLFGAAPLSGTLSVKAAAGTSDAGDDDGTQPPVLTDDPGDPVDPDTAEADAGDPDMTALHQMAAAEMDAAPGGWDAVDAASAIDPGEEDLSEDETSQLEAAADTRRQGAKGRVVQTIAVTGPDGRPAVLEIKDMGTGGTQQDGSSITVSATPWSDFSESDYTPAQWHNACLIHQHGPGVPDTKQDCKLPVREPDGTINKNAVHAAAGALAGARTPLQASSDDKAKAAAALRGLYRKIGDTPPSSLQAKVLTSADVTGNPPSGPSGPLQVRERLSGQPWTGTPDSYTPVQWHDATLIHTHPDGTMPASKDDCQVPVADPDGTLNLTGMHAAADAIDDADATGDQKNGARQALAILFFRTGQPLPDGLQTKVAGQDVTPADMAATERLRQWYEHGGGAAQIGWGVPGDFARCVEIAGKHMDPAKAKGYCQLRHKGATGFYAGHAPAEQALHDAGHAAATSEGKSLVYNPMLESGPLGGSQPPAPVASWEHKQATAGGETLTRSLEESLDHVADAVHRSLAGGMLAGGVPRHLVVVNGTWPSRVIATRYDTARAGLDDAGDSYQIPYSVADDGAVQLGEPQPVTLTVTDETVMAGTKSADDGLSPLPVLVEHITGMIRRDLQVKAGRVLSDANAKLLRGAVDQLLTVLRAAGIPIDVTDSDSDAEEDQAANMTGAEPLYLPDSTAPAAQVNMQKTLLDPALTARAYRITAAAHVARQADGT